MKEESELKSEQRKLTPYQLLKYEHEGLLRRIAQLENNRQTPVVQAKTAEEIMQDFDLINEDGDIEASFKQVRDCLQAYHAQFTQSAKEESTRFEIELSGTPFLRFETEAHITDDQNPTCTIIVKSGYPTIEETVEYANKILKILNNGSL